MYDSPWFDRTRAVIVVLLCYVLYQSIGVGAQFNVSEEHRVTQVETRVDNLEWAVRALGIAVIGQFASGWRKRQGA